MKKVLIIGASAGIGYGLVNKFLDEQYQVFAISRQIDSLQKFIDAGKLCTVIQADITLREDQNKIINQIRDIKGLTVINNAAYSGLPVQFCNLAIEELRKYFETNFFAPMILLRELINANKIERVLNISSGAAQHPLKNLLGYCTSKSALHHAIECLKLEYHDIKFANLRPGLVDTPLQTRWRTIGADVFPLGNPYIAKQESGQLLQVAQVAEFIYKICNLPLQEFDSKYWNIYEDYK